MEIPPTSVDDVRPSSSDHPTAHRQRASGQLDRPWRLVPGDGMTRQVPIRPALPLLLIIALVASVFAAPAPRAHAAPAKIPP
ncbi:hypothetical protein GCM10027614_07350 [Micromonospora vulcania]